MLAIRSVPLLVLFLAAAAAANTAACASSGEDAANSGQDQTAGPGELTESQNLTVDQLAALASIGDGSHAAAVIFPSNGDPQVRGHIVAGGKLTVLYALSRLSQCRASHDGAEIWDTRIGGEFSNGTKIGEERATPNQDPVPGSVRGFDGFGSQFGEAHTIPLTLDVPAGAEAFYLYAHNTSPPGPAPACDTFDSKNSANFQFKVEPATPGPSSGQIVDGSHPDANALAALVDIGDGTNTAAILFPSSGDPVIRGNLVQGGRVIVAYALDRLTQCRASHDGFPFWLTQVGGQFSDGTKVGEETDQSPGQFLNTSDFRPGQAVEFVPVPGQETPIAAVIPMSFAVPKAATDLQLFAHNWNPGGPVSPCTAFDSRNSQNYHFQVQPPR